MPPRITSIKVSSPPNKTVYNVGEYFDPAGMVVKAVYNNGTEQTIYVYMYAPQTPLTTNDTYITITYNLFSTTYPITVNGPVTLPFPTQDLSQSNLGNNPFYNLFDQSIRFIINPISVNRDSYTLSFNLVYHSRMMDRLSDLVYGLPARFKTNYHQYLIEDGLDVNSHSIYKYIDGEGYIHTFTYAYDNFYYCNQSRLYLTFYTESNVTYGKIIDENGNELHFDNNDRLIKIVSSIGQNNVKHVVYSGNYIDYVYDERFSTTKIDYSYNGSNQLNQVSFIYKNYTIKRLLFTYSSGFLTKIEEKDESNNNTQTLYEYSYNHDSSGSSYDRLEYVEDHLNNTFYKFHYLYNSNFDDYIVDSLQSGIFNGNTFVAKDSLTRISHDLRADDNSTSQIVIKNHNNVYFTYHLDRKALITASFESDQYGENLKTLYKESGDYIDINGDLTAGMINTHSAINIIAPLSIPLDSIIVSHLNSYKHFVLRMYVKNKSFTAKRVKAILTSNGISSSVTDLNVDQYNKYQLIEIPFTRDSNNLTNVTLSLSFKDESNNNVSVDIADLYIDKKDRTTLAFSLNYINFDCLTLVNLYGTDTDNPQTALNNTFYPYLSEEDLIHTLRFNKIRSHYFPSLPPIIFLSKGNKIDFYETKFELVVSFTAPFIPYPVVASICDDDLYLPNCLYFLVKSFDGIIETKTYYQFVVVNSVTYLETTTKTITNSDDSTLKQETKRYELYNNRLVKVINSHIVNNNTVSSETTYLYHNNGEISEVDSSSGSQTIVLYKTTENSDGYAYIKTSGLNSVYISYADYLESYIAHNQVINGVPTSTSNHKSLFYDPYKEELRSATYGYESDVLAINGLTNDYDNDETLFTLNSSSFYKLVNNRLNDISILQRYDGSAFENVLSIKQTQLLNEETYYGPTSSSNVVISRDYDIYGKLVDEKENNTTKVTFSYDTSGIESPTVLKNLVSMTDGYINKTTTFSYNGYDYYESSILDDYFEIDRMYNGFFQYCFGNNEAYIYKPLSSNLDIFDNYNNRLYNFSINHVYDGFNRLLERKRLTNGSSPNCFLQDSFIYQNNSMLLSEFKQTHGGLTLDLVNETYSYDPYGNLYSISTSIGYPNVQSPLPQIYERTYIYDGFNRLIQEYNPSYPEFAREYSYNNQGRMEYFDIYPLTYNNKGQLASHGSITFTYDRYGNRLTKTDGNNVTTYTWTRGKLLSSVAGIFFTYDYRGIRYSKDTSKETITYFYDGNKLIGEDHVGKNSNPSFKLRFFYDTDGTPLGFKYIDSTRDEDYIYIVNPFKEIIGISSFNGNDTVSLVARYVYDAWGKHKVLTTSNTEDTDDDSIGNINPLRYKGYYYDKESELYYLLSRYYDPSIGQFISPDDYTYLDINKVSGYHLYAYCNNNPVVKVDPDGHIAATTILLLVGIGVGAAIGAASNTVNQYLSNGGWDNFSWASFGWNTIIGAANGALSMSPLGWIPMIAGSAALGAVGSIGDHIIARDDFSDWRTLVDISLSAGFGALSGILGGEGATYGVDLNSAASAVAKSSLAYSKVVSKATQGGYATARGMSIALSRTGNSLARAISNYCFLTCKVSTNLVKSLAASAFSGLCYSFIGGLFDFEW